MEMTNAQLALTLKRVAANVSGIIKKKKHIQDQIDALEEKLRKQMEEKLAKLKVEYDSYAQQQDIFEKPIREYTGGYGIEDLIETKVVESGTDKNGKPIRKTTYALRYPDTILPPSEVPTTEGAPEEASSTEVPVETDKEESTDFEPAETSNDDLPFA